jgi:hypothetical protein
MLPIRAFSFCVCYRWNGMFLSNRTRRMYSFLSSFSVAVTTAAPVVAHWLRYHPLPSVLCRLGRSPLQYRKTGTCQTKLSFKLLYAFCIVFHLILIVFSASNSKSNPGSFRTAIFKGFPICQICIRVKV